MVACKCAYGRIFLLHLFTDNKIAHFNSGLISIYCMQVNAIHAHADTERYTCYLKANINFDCFENPETYITAGDV